MRRKAGALTQLETDILTYAAQHTDGFHGWQFSKEHRDIPNATIYRSLTRLQQQNYLTAERIDSDQPWLPKRCVFKLTTTGMARVQPNAQPPVPSPWNGSFTARAL